MPTVQKEATDLDGSDLGREVQVIDPHGMNHTGTLVRVDHALDPSRPIQGPFLQLVDRAWMGRVRGGSPVLVEVPVAGVQS